MKKIIPILLFLHLFLFSGYSQNLELNTKSFYGIWNNEVAEYAYGGGGLEIVYEHPLKKGSLRSGLEFRSIDWGNQVSLNIGYQIPYISKDKWALSGITSTGIGLALFQDNPLFVWSVGYMPEFTWPNKQKFNLVVGFGIRYTNSPAYKNYGEINQVLDFPFKIGFKFNLKKKASSKS